MKYPLKTVFKMNENIELCRAKDTSNKEDRPTLPIFERDPGIITYEHSLAERFYNDIYMGAAERNYYVDGYQELCLCAHYNRRIPGKYEFVEEYQFFVTKDRMCLEIYWNLGNISDSDRILEHYQSLEEAENSKFYKDFCDLKVQIEESIEWEKTHIIDPFEMRAISSFLSMEDEKGDAKYTIYEVPISDRKEMVQFYLNNENESWEMMSVSAVELSDMLRFFKDFDVLDKEQLHLRTFYSIENRIMEKEPSYKKAFDEVKAFYEYNKRIVYC